MSLTRNPDAQHLYRPGVGIVLLNKEGRIFLGLRYDSMQSDTQELAWQMPQGGIDEGEEPRVAALRELEEETGVSLDCVTILDETKDWLFYDLPVALYTRLWGGKYIGQRQKWFLMRLVGDDTAINIDHPTHPDTHPEFCKWRWATATEALTHVVPFKGELYTSVFSYFSKQIQKIP